MLIIPTISTFNWIYHNWGTNPSATPGTSVTPGINNAEGSWTQIATAANDIVAQPDTVITSSDKKTLLARVSGGIAGREYKARFQAYTTSNNVFEHDVRIKVEE